MWWPPRGSAARAPWPSPAARHLQAAAGGRPAGERWPVPLLRSCSPCCLPPRAPARPGCEGMPRQGSGPSTPLPEDPDLVHPPPCGDTPSNSCGGDPGTMCFADPTCLVFAGPGCNAGGTSQVCRYCDVGGGTPECEPESPAKANAALGPVVDTGTAAVGTPATTLDGSAASKRSLVAARRGSQPDPGNSEIQHERSSATIQAWRRDSSWAPGDKGAPHSVTIGDDAMPTVTLEARLLSRGSAGIQKPLPAP
ncbi:unnamed protein product [Prorocentrum cordatum]|uniref:Uncharacterized protein n=1 Tax=Prorocentrum cordatum TaxID=2364126 RepID=A0ABN9XXR5_9DINO|nr:unnamed protein product [Polarella glacialis]CAK0903506.1 unnamed protein product [Polarella glacialis]